MVQSGVRVIWEAIGTLASTYGGQELSRQAGNWGLCSEQSPEAAESQR